jgi:hypothetical protein
MTPNTITLLQAAALIAPIVNQTCDEAKNDMRLVNAGKTTELSIAIATALQYSLKKAEA